MSFQTFSMGVPALLGMSMAWSQTGTSTLSTFPSASKNKQNFSGQLRLEGMEYMTALPDEPQLSHSQFLSAQLNYLGDTNWFENAFDASAGTFFSRAQSHIAVHELYTSPRTSGYRFYVGRKLNAWSEMDRQWNMGVWQPYFEMDALRPEAQGLTGVFFDVNRENFQFLAFASPIFIPSMGPDIREENGSLVSDSRWYRAPTDEVELGNKSIPVTYRLSIPQAAELAGHGGYGAMGRLGDKNQGAWMVGSFGYTPLNQLILKRQIRKQIDTPSAGVVVSPDVTYHQVFSTDLGYTMGNVKASASYMQDEVEQRLPEEGWAIQRPEGLRAYSVGLDWKIPKVLSRTILLQLGYLKVDGGKIRDIVSDGNKDDITLYDQRLKFTNAVSVKAQGELARIGSRPLVTKLAWLYDQDQKGSMINAEFLFYPSQEWAFLMGADFLGVEDENYNPSSFLNQYRANDRVYGGMTYVF